MMEYMSSDIDMHEGRKMRKRVYYNDPQRDVSFKRVLVADDCEPRVLFHMMFSNWLKVLCDKDKSIILLRYSGFKKQGEIADIMGCSQPYIHKRLQVLKRSYAGFFNIKLPIDWPFN